MSGYTPNLNLFEYNPTTDGNQTFNIKNVLNDNFDKIDTYCKGLSDDKADTDDVNTALALKADKTVLHALKGYSDNGELLTDAEGLADVKNYAHSTFDRSKFTIVGSPNITDDGVASGFSTSKYITFPYSTFRPGSRPWKVTAKVKTPSTITSGGHVICAINPSSTTDVDYGICIQIPNDQTKINFQAYDDNHTQIFSNIVDGLSANTEYLIGMEFTGTQYKGYINGEVVTTFNSTTPIAQSIAINNIIGVRGTAQKERPWEGSIDLKQLSITVEGVPVFSGNKTGVDTIKPDDYTVVGSPTISADGVASGFSATSYINTASLDITNATDFEFITPWFRFNAAPSTGYEQVISWTTSNYSVNNNTVFNVGRRNSSQALEVIVQNHSVDVNLSKAFLLNPTLGLYYQVKFTYKNNSWAAYYRTKENTTWINIGLSANTDEYGVNIQGTRPIGWRQNGEHFISGDVDLNGMQIFAYGNLVYQPCLKIPYTKGSDQYGGKYVNAQYLPRVKDAYEQGLANDYFTLDEANGTYTLPMGNLYGYIEKRARDIAHPVAVPFFRLTDEINEDEVRLEGAEVDKGLYLAIEQKLAAYCSASEDTTKIILPNFTNRVPWGDNTQGYIEAGLPNITGDARFCAWASTGATGAFSQTQYNYGFTQGGYNGGVAVYNSSLMKFNASDSSPIYGNSPTVQPPAFKVRWLARWR